MRTSRFRPSPEDLAELADLLRLPPAQRGLAQCDAIGVVLVKMKPEPWMPKSGQKKKPYSPSWIMKLVNLLKREPYNLPVPSGNIYRYRKFGEADLEFRTECLQAPGLTWEHVIRLLPVADPKLRMKLLREHVRKPRSVRSVRSLRRLVFERAGCLPPRGRKWTVDVGPSDPGAAARHLLRVCRAASGVGKRWLDRSDGVLVRLHQQKQLDQLPVKPADLRSAVSAFQRAADDLEVLATELDKTLADAAVANRAELRAQSR